MDMPFVTVLELAFAVGAGVFGAWILWRWRPAARGPAVVVLGAALGGAGLGLGHAGFLWTPSVSAVGAAAVGIGLLMTPLAGDAGIAGKRSAHRRMGGAMVAMGVVASGMAVCPQIGHDPRSALGFWTDWFPAVGHAILGLCIVAQGMRLMRPNYRRQ
ncbi:MAG TPA: hypothetical protein VGM37_08665 [Armatimonadota bacterium]|jgi:hypothetical protein